MKVYEAVFNEAKNKGVWGISLVEDPAMEETFLALSKADSKIELKTLDEEQRIIVGLVLEPDKKVYRNQGGEEFEMFFSKETVKDLMYNFAKQGYQTNSSIEHSGQRIEGVSFTEMWLVRDEKMDTAISLGLSPKEGSWMAVSKIDSDDVWNDYVKTGKVKGYSIDAFVELQEVKLNKDKQMEKTILEEIKDISKAIMLTLNPAKEEVKLGSVNSVDGTALMYDGETPEVGGAVYLMDADGETKIPLPVGEYALEGGGNLSVIEEGIIASIGVAEEEEAPAELAEPVAAPAAATAADVAAEIKSVLIKYTEDAKTERLEFEKAIKLELETFKGQLVEFSNKPAASKTVSAPTLRQGTKQNYIEFLNNKL